MIIKYISILLLSTLIFANSSAQKDVEDLSWKAVVYGQEDDWYGTEEALRIADNVMLYQRDIGGWDKNIPMHKTLTKKEKKELQKLKAVDLGCTTDNGATIMEITFLSKVYGKTGYEPCKASFLRAINYILEAQYENGGWPQFYPPKKGYSRYITYNDGSMINIMEVLKEVSEKSDVFSIIANDETAETAKSAFEKGIDIILKTQYKQNGELTVWCAQHDDVTLEPALARSYELPSLSGSESAGIARLLMDIKKPSAELIKSIQSAVNWFEKSKIKGYRVEVFTNEDGLKDRRVIAEADAPPMWARFYDLEDNRPIFSDRDGVKKYSLAEIGYERRNNYGYYSYSPQSALDKYVKWRNEWAPEKAVYMFSYFTGNGEDGLHQAHSEDGLKWEALKHGESYLRPEAGADKLMRDPCIIRGGDGNFHMVWTVSWAEKGIGYASSSDLINWSDQVYIPVMENEDSAMNCWAPEIFYDENQELYMIYWATTILGKFPETEKFSNNRKRDHRMYYITTKDFKTFSETALLYDQGFNVIDAVILKESGEYLMFLKDETSFPNPQKNIRIARSKYLTHGYSKPGEAISPDSIWVEGPSITKSNDEWILYYDQYRLGAMGGMKSADLISWTDISDQISFPEGTRHGTVFKVPESIYNNLLNEEIVASQAEEKVFEELLNSEWVEVFSDDCTSDWSGKWLLDGKIGYVENSSEGMDFYAGPEVGNDAHHAVLWTRETFSGDLLIEYDYTRLDEQDNQVNIIYIEATGSGKGKYKKEIFEWNDLREVPSMRTYYNNMNTLHISYAALDKEGDYIRARRYRPDVGTGLKGTDIGATFNTGFFETGVRHHISILKKNFDLYMKVVNDQKTVLYKFNYQNHPEIVEGRIGLRHMYSRSARYSNFIVKTPLPDN